MDSYCWAAVQQKESLQGDSGNLPLWLHKVTGIFTSHLFTLLMWEPRPREAVPVLEAQL